MFGHAMPWIVGGAAAVSPPPAANMFAWYQKGVGITSVANAVSAWSDQSGNAHDLSATGTAKPTLQAAGTLLFDGTANVLKTASIGAHSQPLTFYARFRLPTTPAGANRYLCDGLNPNGSIIFFPSGSLAPNTFAGSFGPIGSSVGLNTWASVGYSENGASSVIQVESTSSATGNSGGSAPGGITLCAQGNGAGNFCNAEIAEFIAYSVAHDATTRALVIAYLDSVI